MTTRCSSRFTALIFLALVISAWETTGRESNNMPKDPTRHQLDSPRKNRFIGAVQVHNNISCACRDHGIPSYSTGRDLWNKFEDTGSTASRPRSGRPSIFSKPEKEHIVAIVRNNRRKPFTEIANELTPGPTVSEATIRRIAGEKGYHRRVARRVPYLSDTTKAKRKAWAKDRKAMITAEWSDVWWSDEAYICLDDKKGRVFVSRRPDEELLEECCVGTVSQNPIRVMVWGIIAKGATGPLIVLEYPGGKGGGMNSERYIKQVLEGPLLPFFNKMKRYRPNFKFQQDGAPGHRAKVTHRWLKEHCVLIFPHPPSSPDVSPIEPLWQVLKNGIRAYKPRPTSYEALCEAIHAVWDQITIQQIDHFVDWIPKIVDVLIDADGRHTGY